MTVHRSFVRGALACTLLLALAFAAGVSGCDDEDDDDDRGSRVRNPLAGYDVVVDANDDGETVELRVGETLAIVREQNATIPYDDILVELAGCLTFDGMDSLPQDEPIAEGQGYTAIWEFTASAPGRGTVVIELWGMEYTMDDPVTGERIIDPALEVEARTEAAARAPEEGFDEASYFDRFTLEVVVED